MTNKKGYRLVFIILAVIILVFLFLKYRRESDKWTEKIKLVNGDKIEVHHNYSHRAMYGPLHFLIGGGGEKYKVSFDYKGTSFKWECLHTPIVIQFRENSLYIVMLNSESLSNIHFRFYKYEKGLIEISAKDFPKSIAIQNRWSFRGDEYFRHQVPVEEYKIDIESKEFRYSVLAKLWLRLEKGIEYEKYRYRYIDKGFLFEFKKKYIEPISIPSGKR